MWQPTKRMALRMAKYFISNRANQPPGAKSSTLSLLCKSENVSPHKQRLVQGHVAGLMTSYLKGPNRACWTRRIPELSSAVVTRQRKALQRERRQPTGIFLDSFLLNSARFQKHKPPSVATRVCASGCPSRSGLVGGNVWPSAA